MTNENTTDSIPPSRGRFRLSFVFLCLGGLFILPLGLLAIISHFVEFEIPKNVDNIVGPALFGLLLIGVICLAIGARLLKLGK